MAPKRGRSCEDALRLKRPRWKQGVLRLPDGCSRVAPERLAEALRSLGVGEGASVEEIRKGYRRQALLSHPDRGGSAEHFRSLVEALEVALAARSGSEAAAAKEEQAAGRLQRQARAVALKAALTDAQPATLEARLARLTPRELEELEELLAASALVPTEAKRRRSLGQLVGTSQDQLRGISRVVRRGMVQYQVRTTWSAPSSSFEEVLKLTSSPSGDLTDAVDALAAIEQAKADAARMLLSGAGVEEAAATLVATGVQLTFQWRFILEEGSHTLYGVSDLPTSLDHRRRFREALESRDALQMRRLKELFRREVTAARAFHAAEPGRLLRAVRELRLASAAVVIVEQPPMKRPRVAVDDVDLDRKRLRAKEEEAFEAALGETLQGLVDCWAAEEQTVEAVPATPASQPTQLWGWSPPILVDDEAPVSLEPDPHEEEVAALPHIPPPAVPPPSSPAAPWRNMVRVAAVVAGLAVLWNG